MLRTDSVESIDATIQLRDGRTLGYAEYGQASGKALLYFGGSHLKTGMLACTATEAGLCLIGIDRPGKGWSQFQKGRCLLDWPADVVELADRLQIDRFVVVGVSEGGPHALACAYTIPNCLTACGIVSGVGQVRVRFFQRLPWLLTPMKWVMSRFFRDEEHGRSSLTRFTRSWPELDRKSLRAPEIRDLWAASLVEAFRRGARGLTYDTLLGEEHPWGFKLEDIAFPSMSFGMTN
jgi:pimeloyl-ACP methyl ester carboxylesterase